MRSGPVDAETLTKLSEILGVTSEQVVDAEWLDNGPGWAGVLLDSAQTVLDLRPDASAHPGRWDIGAIGAHNVGAEAALEVLAFFTEGDEPLREDPVTGSLNASAAEWLIATDRVACPYRQGHSRRFRSRRRFLLLPESTYRSVSGRDPGPSPSQRRAPSAKRGDLIGSDQSAVLLTQQVL